VVVKQRLAATKYAAALAFALAMSSAVTHAQPSTQVPSVLDLPLEELMKVRVTTASRLEEQLTRSTSTMTVITARDIDRAGFRTVYDVLARVPGFFVSSQATWKLVGTRGLIADGNDHVLLLIDGHAQNSILAHGFQQQDQMPTLEKVQRIEIIRGPGSVLWGASAAHAIINIVTRDSVPGGSNVQVSTGYTHGDALWNLNLLKNVQMGDDATGIVSASVWQADGYNTPAGPNVKFPWGSTTNLWPRLDAQHAGFELYLKLKQGDRQQILARIAQTSVPYPWDDWSYDPAGGVRPGADLRMRKAYLNYQTTAVARERLEVKYTLFGDMLLQNRFPSQDTLGVTGDTRWVEDQSREELAFGGEVTATRSFTDDHQILFGSKYVHTIAGPNRGFRFDTATNLPTVAGPGEQQVPVIDIPSGNDNSAGVYVEDRYAFNEGKTSVFGGLRADYNDWRENRTVVLPRGGIIHSLSNRAIAKYVFNTGYLRPNAAYSHSGGKFYRSPSKTIENVNVVDRSEQVQSHDLQLSFAPGRNHLMGTLFYMSVDDFISWETKLDLGYRDMGAAYSYGAEIEGRYFVHDAVALTGNYSVARGYLREIPTGVDRNGVLQVLDGALTTPDRRWLNYPTHTWNIGADFSIRPRQSLTANVRGWTSMQIVQPFTAANPGAYGRLSGEAYVDANYLAKEVLAGTDLRLSAMNLFDNTGAMGMAINNGVFHPRGRSLGLQLTKRF
jgi:outer membrane receptor protein involved in Fe transport